MKAHLNYITATGIDVWNGDPEHVIDVIPNFTKPDIEDQRNQACQLEDAMVAEIIYSSVCVCCGHRCPHRDMQIGLKDTICYCYHNTVRNSRSYGVKTCTP